MVWGAVSPFPDSFTDRAVALGLPLPALVWVLALAWWLLHAWLRGGPAVVGKLDRNCCLVRGETTAMLCRNPVAQTTDVL